MNPRKWKMNLNNYIFMLYKSAETCHPVSLPFKGTNILIFVTCGEVLPVGMICTTTNTISIPVGEMYLHARMFCALSHVSYSHGYNTFLRARTFYTR